MADQLFEGGAHEDARIDVNEEQSLEYWCKAWHVSKDDLRRAVDQVGPRVKDVRQHLIGGFNASGPTS